LFSEASTSKSRPTRIATDNDTIDLIFQFSSFQLFKSSIAGSLPNAWRGDINIGHLLVAHGTFKTDILWGRLWLSRLRRRVDRIEKINRVCRCDVCRLLRISTISGGDRRRVVGRGGKRHYL